MSYASGYSNSSDSFLDLTEGINLNNTYEVKSLFESLKKSLNNIPDYAYTNQQELMVALVYHVVSNKLCEVSKEIATEALKTAQELINNQYYTNGFKKAKDFQHKVIQNSEDLELGSAHFNNFLSVVYDHFYFERMAAMVSEMKTINSYLMKLQREENQKNQ